LIHIAKELGVNLAIQSMVVILPPNILAQEFSSTIELHLPVFSKTCYILTELCRNI